MRILFFAIAAAGGGYFLFARRRFDAFSLAFVSAVVYFLPGFFGYALQPPSRLQTESLKLTLIPETYGVFCLVLGAIASVAIYLDRRPPRHDREIRFPQTGAALWMLAAAAALGCVVTVTSAGGALLSPDKTIVLSSLGRWRIVWVTGASLGTLLAFLQRRWMLFALCGALLVLDFYLGFRNHLALTTLALFTLALHRKGPQRVALDSYRILLGGGLAALGFFIYKFFYALIKQGLWEVSAKRLVDPVYLAGCIIRSEPFTTQAILNQVLAERLHTELSGLKQLLYQVVIYAPRFGVEIHSITDQLRETLFPGALSGLGCNVWAEMWSRGGWTLLVLFVALFCAALALTTRLLSWQDPLIRSGIALAASYWAFYIHRNALGYQINLQKRVLLIWLMAVLVGLTADALCRVNDRRRRSPWTAAEGRDRAGMEQRAAP